MLPDITAPTPLPSPTSGGRQTGNQCGVSLGKRGPRPPSHRERPQLRPPEPNPHNPRGDTAPMTTTDERLAVAQQRVYRSKAKLDRARQRLEHDIKRRDELCPVARGHQAIKKAWDACQTITENQIPPAPTLDSDPRTPADQAHEFFTRPGDFYQVRLAVPLDAAEFGEKLGAQFMAKADDTQLPYLLEVLRQLRGALGGGNSVELTKARITPPDGPPMVPGVDVTLGDRFPSMPIGTIQDRDDIIGVVREENPPFDQELRMGDLVDQVAEVAEQHGVKPEQVQVIPVRGGGYAFTIQPVPQPPVGRHARPDDADVEDFRGCCGTSYTGRHVPGCGGDPNYQHD